jgi:hypothetical protein
MRGRQRSVAKCSQGEGMSAGRKVIKRTKAPSRGHEQRS